MHFFQGNQSPFIKVDNISDESVTFTIKQFKKPMFKEKGGYTFTVKRQKGSIRENGVEVDKGYLIAVLADRNGECNHFKNLIKAQKPNGRSVKEDFYSELEFAFARIILEYSRVKELSPTIKTLSS